MLAGAEVSLEGLGFVRLQGVFARERPKLRAKILFTMAYDKFSTEWHLTNDGWQRGSNSYDSDHPQPAPANRLLTLTRHLEQSSPYSIEHVSWCETWRSSALTGIERKDLLASFGDKPGGEGWPARRHYFSR